MSRSFCDTGGHQLLDSRLLERTVFHTSASCHGCRSSSGLSECCHRFAHSFQFDFILSNGQIQSFAQGKTHDQHCACPLLARLPPMKGCAFLPASPEGHLPPWTKAPEMDSISNVVPALDSNEQLTFFKVPAISFKYLFLQSLLLLPGSLWAISFQFTVWPFPVGAILWRQHPSD